jgi:hypothetical protein
MWKYFAPVDADFAKYDFCKQKLSYRSSISNLMKHLQNRHRTTSAARISISHIYEAQEQIILKCSVAFSNRIAEINYQLGLSIRPYV